jgi:hypothetical protein
MTSTGDSGRPDAPLPTCPKHGLPLVRVNLTGRPPSAESYYFRCSKTGCVYTLLEKPPPPPPSPTASP